MRLKVRNLKDKTKVAEINPTLENVQAWVKAGWKPELSVLDLQDDPSPAQIEEHKKIMGIIDEAYNKDNIEICEIIEEAKKQEKKGNVSIETNDKIIRDNFIDLFGITNEKQEVLYRNKINTYDDLLNANFDQITSLIFINQKIFSRIKNQIKKILEERKEKEKILNGD